MADLLPSVLTDNGLKESIPVTPFDPLGNYAGNVTLIPLGYQQVALTTTTAVVLASLVPGAVRALIKIEGADARYRDDGVDPTAAIGMPIGVGESLDYDVHMNGTDFRIIGQAGGSVCNIAFYGTQEP